ncbi:nucleoside 2-deoxyribosyltransferase [Leuconostoc inhae]|uniref:nucleoside 2-deoxyribosyltransferase n=1 Tax=Leuconostoc inhae TaxID=178001 RepID=UPI001C7CF640|nr:nucleoside 2-deoxyribosyltransferase [Leuconostoc inhae]
MNETKLIADLEEINRHVDNDKKLPGAKNIYLAAGWFSDTQEVLLKDAFIQLSANPTIAHIHVPLLHQYGGMALGDANSEPDFEWGAMTYKADIKAIDNSDLTVAIFEAEDADTGTAMELGYSVASNTPVVSVFSGNIDEHPINLMLSFGTDAHVTSTAELATYDFFDITPNKYMGKLI